ncbi:DUF7344 domain-containing protein [Natrinema caseinilyticum]|uniref:DUF7344 domain-containing protein n=1 Tax=Natrinema caseinilyticum TaxID=2961570 RepID=UPI0020C3BC6F|nr:hypothetical protein [Natrinema caseinilyticum]
MSNSPTSGSGPDSRDEFFGTLADARRRIVVRIVSERSPEGIGKNDLAFRLAAVIIDTPPDTVSDSDHQRALVDLHHRLLPQLADAGVLEETDDGAVVTTDHRAFEDTRFERPVSIGRGDEPDDHDAVFKALADDRRRTVLSVLAGQYRPIDTETLARDVAVREADATEREISDRRVDDVYVSLVHVHLPLLTEATLVSYDAEEGRVSYEGHPLVPSPNTITLTG